MSMIGNLARVPDSILEKLHQNPEWITRFIYPDTTTPAVERKTGLFGSLFGKKASGPKPPPALAEALSEGDTLDFGKAWHGLHFLFTGTDWEGDFPQGFLLSCGKPIGEVDVGYGPARSFDAAEVQKIAAFLDDLDEGTLRSRFDLQKMAELELYPNVWAEAANAEEELNFLLEGFREVKQFVHDTAAAGLGLMVYLN